MREPRSARDCVVEDGAVLGKRPRLRPGSSAARSESGPLVLADGVTVCAGAVIYAWARIDERVIIGDQAQVRERATIGTGSVIGRGSSVDFDAVVGARVLIQTGVYVTAGTVVEDDVFLGPGATTTNDDTMGRHPPRREARRARAAPRLPDRWRGGARTRGRDRRRGVRRRRRGCDPRRTRPGVVMGVPARIVREVADEDLLERWR